jgi:LmbE family N-acetylglucosaminyl deacetylase
MGAEVHYVIVSDGSKGSDDRNITPDQLIAMRESEQRDAVKEIGGKGVRFLGYSDGEIEITMALKQDIAREIRRLKPDVVITMDPTVIYNVEMGFINHPDHRAVGQATIDAVFPLARDHMSLPVLLEEGLEPHKTTTLLLSSLSGSSANYYEDITSTFGAKFKALEVHKSQVVDPASTNKWLKELAANAGKRHGVELAEEFVRIDIR